jgi:hypothetical protein
MTLTSSQTSEITVRQLQHRDLEAVAQLCQEATQPEATDDLTYVRKWQTVSQWYGVLKFLSMFPNPLQHLCSVYVAEQGDRLRGVIQVAPFNRTHSTWRVDQVLLGSASNASQTLSLDIGSQLLRHCFQSIWEARTWLIEVNINDKDTLALYRHNGFQPLAHVTYWTISPELIQELAEREPDLPNLLPISNADACLLHQLDTVSMPPLIRQVFDRNILDFKTNLVEGVVETMKHRLNHIDMVSGYVFEPQRKAAIGYFKLHLSQDGSKPHSAHLTVHPAYTWLYPELMAQMARVANAYPAQSLQLTSSDYHPEREEYLERIGAERTEHTLLMSRSVWHKLRESKPVSLEGLQLSEVLQGFQPTRKPVPGRFSLADSISQLSQLSSPPDRSYPNRDDHSTPTAEKPSNGQSKPSSQSPDQA